MKKRSILVNFRFETDVEYAESRIVSVKFNSNNHPTEQELVKFACEVVTEWFRLMHPESRLISVVGYCSLEVDYSNHPHAEVSHSGMSKHSKVVEAPGRRPEMEFGPYKSTDHPPVDLESDDNGSMSDYVLIDLDGKAIDFEVGYFNFDRGTWQLRNGDRRSVDVDLDHMKWEFLPLAKYHK